MTLSGQLSWCQFRRNMQPKCVLYIVPWSLIRLQWCLYCIWECSECNAQISMYLFIYLFYLLSSNQHGCSMVLHTNRLLQIKQLPIHFLLSLCQTCHQQDGGIWSVYTDWEFNLKDSISLKQLQSLQLPIGEMHQSLSSAHPTKSVHDSSTLQEIRLGTVWHRLASETNVELLLPWPSRDISHFLATLFDTNEGETVS